MFLWPVSLAMVTKGIPVRRMYMIALDLRGCRSSLGTKFDIYWQIQKIIPYVSREKILFISYFATLTPT